MSLLDLAASRRALVALALIGPPIGVALIVVTLAGYRLVQPDSILFVELPAPSFADALEHREVEVAYAFIREGADPNAALTVQDAALTGGRRVDVSPLMLAVASRNRNAVMMLLSAGVNADVPANRLAICLAHELGETDLATMIVNHGRVSATPVCPQPPYQGEPLLVRYGQSAPP